MGTLRIFFFGNFRITVDGKPGEIQLTRGSRELFAYLLLQGNRTHPRDVLVGTFWGEHNQKHARYCLNTALWRLRCSLEPENIPRGTYLITTPEGYVGFNKDSDYWLDVADFNETAHRFVITPYEQHHSSDIADLENALSLYTGDLLEGNYYDWALRERERLRLLYLDSLASLMYCYKNRGEYIKSLSYALKILEQDPLREEIHREIMRIYHANGQRTLAIRQYEHCQKTLREELNLPPMEETSRLYEQILKNTSLEKKPVHFSDTQSSHLAASIRQLDDTMRMNNDIQIQLEKTVQQLYDELKALEP